MRDQEPRYLRGRVSGSDAARLAPLLELRLGYRDSLRLFCLCGSACGYLQREDAVFECYGDVLGLKREPRIRVRCNRQRLRAPWSLEALPSSGRTGQTCVRVPSGLGGAGRSAPCPKC